MKTAIATAAVLLYLAVASDRFAAGGAQSAPQGPAPAPATAAVTLANGQKFAGPIVRYDDFVIAIRTADGAERSFRRDGDAPKVEIRDPKDAHRKLWPTLSNSDMHDVTAYLVTLK
jgi:cytochrome c oxidase cbb3-type subunit 3